MRLSAALFAACLPKVEYCHTEYPAVSDCSDGAFQKHKNLCTADHPFRPKGTGLGGGGATQPSSSAQVGHLACCKLPRRLLHADNRQGRQQPHKPFCSLFGRWPEQNSLVDATLQATVTAYVTPAVSKKATPSSLAPGPAQRPLAYQCYICGCQFGSSSLHIHIPQCQA